MMSMINLASMHRGQGQWIEAERLEVQVMKRKRGVCGAEHADTLVSVGNLASTDRNPGRWSEAENLELHVMRPRKGVLEKGRPETLMKHGRICIDISASRSIG